MVIRNSDLMKGALNKDLPRKNPIIGNADTVDTRPATLNDTTERRLATPAPDLRDSPLTSTVHGNKTSLTSLAPYIEGYQGVSVTYYSQYLQSHDPVEAFSLSLSNVHQSYTEIKDFEIKISSDIPYTRDKEVQRDTFRGSAVIYGGTIIPNRYDVFILDMGSGPIMFNITDSEPMTNVSGSVYEVEFSSIGMYNEERKRVLESKVVHKLIYSRSRLVQGLRPLLKTEEAESIANVESLGGHLLNAYANDFINYRRSRYLILPGEKDMVFDPFIQNAWYRLIDASRYKGFDKLHWLDISTLPSNQVVTIWDSMLDMIHLDKKATRHRIEKQLYVTDILALREHQSLGTLGGPYYSQLNKIITPVMYGGSLSFCEGIEPSLAMIKDIEEAIRDSSVEGFEGLLENGNPIAYPIGSDDYYVFSEAFYKTDTPNMSALEFLVHTLLKGERLDVRLVTKLAEACFTWGSLERFYYTPVIMMLLNYVRVNINS